MLLPFARALKGLNERGCPYNQGFDYPWRRLEHDNGLRTLQVTQYVLNPQ